jgi:hypothetical protein
MGGEVVEIETTRAFDGNRPRERAVVRAVRQPGPRNIWSSPTMLVPRSPHSSMRSRRQAVDVVNAREYRPSFDEVFAELVNRTRPAATKRAGDEAAGGVAGTAARAPLMALLKLIARVSAVLRKEIIECCVGRRHLQPHLGPFLIMALFGIGYSGVRRPLDTVIVIPPTAACRPTPSNTRTWPVPVSRSTPSPPTRQQPRSQLRAQASISWCRSARPRAAVPRRQARPGQGRVQHRGPGRGELRGLPRRTVERRDQRALIEHGAEQGEQQVITQAPGASLIPPEVIAQPVEVVTTNLAPTQPQVVAFFGRPWSR